ncbi:PQQ-binding-like beta-propeller repeat protein [Roseiconus nitratireducens]|uniref:PQQ-binding-like beta-propeller repeat protein n=1 Tax=Roseiconus nitratireducens TaxID=2605748 RepID=A0A5M6D2D6_9BACT|nr:PQQ-binding-like beta-propeller repeat protein [Roseiconus nitratireducens]KAA5540462.1 PQQ-binding-like beta-propeller repeat protein [Roseiconus nitratireducens]
MNHFHRRIFCTLGLLTLASASAVAEDWPQWRGVGRDATIQDDDLPRSLPEGPLPRKWSTPVGPGYSGPTIANGRVYLTDRSGQGSEVQERVLCFSADTGELLWQHAYPVEYSIGYQASGPRAAVTVDRGQAIAVGGMGMMCCLDAETGELKWSRDLQQDYDARMPIWGITAAPLVYQDLVIQVAAGEGEACLVALDRETGKQRWQALDEPAGYSAPILIRQGQQDVVVCWTGASVSGLDPATGKVFWSIEMKPRNMPIGVPTPAVRGDKLFVSSFYDGSLLIELDQTRPAAKQLWRRIGIDERNTDALHAMISGPIIKGDYIYGADSYGEFRCLDLKTGDRIWEDLSVVPKARWATVHIIRNGNDEIMLNDRGELLMTTLSPEGIEIRSRSQLIQPTTQQLKRRDGVVWAHPAIADGKVFARNDEELVCAELTSGE